MMFDIDLETLRENLKGGSPVAFSYFKKDGKLRNAVGTLNLHLIPEEHRIKEKDSSSNKKRENFSYFDLERNAWRSLHKDCNQVSMIE